MTRASQRASWRVRHCCCRARCVRLPESVPAHPSGSARSGSPRRWDREPAISRFAYRTRHAGRRPTVCSPPGAGPICQRHSCREPCPLFYRERRCASASRPRSAPSIWPDRKSRGARGSSKRPALWMSRRTRAPRPSCRPRSRRIAGSRGSRRAARRRAHVPGLAHNCKPPPADRRRPMADRRARWPRSSPVWSARGPDRAPERPSHRRISGSRPASSHAAASPPGQPRPPRSPSRTTEWSDRG